MTQHQQPYKFTSLPKPILVIYVYVFLQVVRCVHLGQAIQHTNTTDQSPQPIYAHIRGCRTNNNVIYTPEIVNSQHATTNAHQPTPQPKEVPLNPPLDYWKPQYSNYLCRKNRRERPQYTFTRLHNTKEKVKIQIAAPEKSKPQQQTPVASTEALKQAATPKPQANTNLRTRPKTVEASEKAKMQTTTPEKRRPQQQIQAASSEASKKAATPNPQASTNLRICPKITGAREKAKTQITAPVKSRSQQQTPVAST